MGPLAIVPDEKGFARLQSSIEVDDGDALSILSRYDTVTGLENETAELGHPPFCAIGASLSNQTRIWGC
jgi:uncharacterized protein with PIN domain